MCVEHPLCLGAGMEEISTKEMTATEAPLLQNSSAIHLPMPCAPPVTTATLSLYSKKEVLEAFAKEIISRYGKVDYIVNNALPLMKGLDACTWEEFQYALSVGVTAPFYLVKALLTI